MGEMTNKASRFMDGALVWRGSRMVVMVVGMSANENSTDTSAKGTKPKRSPTKISHWPSAMDTPLTAI